MTFNIREATYKDQNTIKNLVDSLLKELENTVEETGIKYDELIDKILTTSDSSMILLAENSYGKTIGMLTLFESFSIYAGGKFAIVNELYVTPEYRSAGIGKMFIGFIKKIAIEKKWRRIELTAPERKLWKRTISFYEREGFIEIGPRLKYETVND